MSKELEERKQKLFRILDCIFLSKLTPYSWQADPSFLRS